LGSEFTVELWIQAFTAMINVEALTAFLAETHFMFLTDPDCLPVRMVSALHPIFSIFCSQFTPLESPNIYAGDGSIKKH